MLSKTSSIEKEEFDKIFYEIPHNVKLNLANENQVKFFILNIQNNQYYVNSDLVECTKEYLVQEEYAIPGEKGSYFINKQSIAYDNMKRSESYSFSAPTSLGKTFIIRMFIKECILSGEKANFVIVVPTNALINEIYNNIMI